MRDHLGFGGWFTNQFISFKTGEVKPDISAFRLVETSLNMSPNQILFLDDSPLNIEGAERAGWSACQVHGTTELASVLTTYGLL
jgi:HAD superfamily hydrolase (TIGR01509 family)